MGFVLFFSGSPLTDGQTVTAMKWLWTDVGGDREISADG
jgi:hypothetical protein